MPVRYALRTDSTVKLFYQINFTNLCVCVCLLGGTFTKTSRKSWLSRNHDQTWQIPNVHRYCTRWPSLQWFIRIAMFVTKFYHSQLFHFKFACIRLYFSFEFKNDHVVYIQYLLHTVCYPIIFQILFSSSLLF